MTRELRDVRVGQVWRDRDSRMGDRRVRVTAVAGAGDAATVSYQGVVGNNYQLGAVRTVYRSRYNRFQRAFDLVFEG